MFFKPIIRILQTKQVLNYDVYYDLLIIFDNGKISSHNVEYGVYTFKSKNRNKIIEFEVILN